METVCKICGCRLLDDQNIARDNFGVNLEAHADCLAALTPASRRADMSDVKLLPCPFCGGTDTTIEGKGMVWSGVKGYSDPQWYELRHWGVLSQDDPFNRCDITLRCRSEAEAIAAWNMRTATSDGRAEGMREAAALIQERRDGRYKFAAEWVTLDEAADAILARAAELEKADE